MRRLLPAAAIALIGVGAAQAGERGKPAVCTITTDRTSQGE